MIKILNILSAFRIWNIIIGIFSGYLAAEIISPGINFMSILNLMSQIFLVMAFGNLINDFQDIETDKISHPNRHLVLGTITFKETKKILSLLVLLIIAVSISFNIQANLFLYVIILPLLTFYNKLFKSIPLLGNIVIAFLLSSIFIFTELLLTGGFSVLYFPCILIFSLSFIREFLKDIQDYKGDFMSQINTLPVYIGKQRSINVAIILILCFVIFLLLPYHFGYFNYIYLYSIIILIEIPLIIMVFLLLNNPSNISFKYMIFLTKVMSLIGLFIIFILYR